MALCFLQGPPPAGPHTPHPWTLTYVGLLKENATLLLVMMMANEFEGLELLCGCSPVPASGSTAWPPLTPKVSCPKKCSGCAAIPF